MGMHRKIMIPALQGCPFCRRVGFRSGTVPINKWKDMVGTDESKRTMGSARERLDNAEEEARRL